MLQQEGSFREGRQVVEWKEVLKSNKHLAIARSLLLRLDQQMGLLVNHSRTTWHAFHV
jgi:hypothetical protein